MRVSSSCQSPKLPNPKTPSPTRQQVARQAARDAAWGLLPCKGVGFGIQDGTKDFGIWAWCLDSNIRMNTGVGALDFRIQGLG